LKVFQSYPATSPCLVYICTVWSEPKSEVVFGSAEVKP